MISSRLATIIGTDAVTLAQAADYIPGRPHVSTLWRWRTRGVRGVKLETIVVGGRRMIAVSAIERFLAALNSIPSADDGSPRAEAVDRALQDLGC